MMPQIRQSPLDTAIAPDWIVFGRLDNKLLDLLSDTRSATQSSLLTAVTLLSDQALVPPEENDGRDKRSGRCEALPAEWIGECSKAAAFSVDQAQPSTTEVRFQDTVFCYEMGNDVLPVPPPARNHGDEHV
jgi:hypothetical protein